MIFTAEYSGPAQSYLELASLFPSKLVAMLLIFLSIGFLIHYLRKSSADFQHNNYALFIASLAYVGVHFLTLSYLDENSVNLEHAYNLFHHGLFSFSPKTMVDGTVEFLYHLLLTPFAFSISSLIQANIALGLVIGWLHLFILWKLLADNDAGLKLFSLILFSAYIPLVAILSNGFGNSLVSLIFFLSIYYHLKGNNSKALIIAALLPLVRVDAILYSLAVFFVYFIKERKISLPALTITGLSLLGYFGFVKFFYGHWIPTPIKFKSFTPAMISLISPSEIKFVLRYFFRDYHIGFFLVFFISLFFRNKLLRLLQLYFIPLMGICIFYFLARLDPVWDHDDRYFVGFELYQILFIILFIKILSEHLMFESAQNSSRSALFSIHRKKYLTLASFVLLVSSAHYFIKMEDIRRTHFQSYYQGIEIINMYGVGGQVVDRLIPETWTLSATEINTVGLVNDHEIIDLWGYTNPAIANSHIINARKVRNNPDYFLTVRPDVFWFYTQPTRQSAYLGPNLDGLEALTGDPGFSWSRRYNQLGNMVTVFQSYDGYVIHGDGWTTLMLVKRDLRDSFHKILAGKNYKLTKQREFDWEKLEEYIKSVPLEQYILEKGRLRKAHG